MISHLLYLFVRLKRFSGLCWAHAKYDQYASFSWCYLLTFSFFNKQVLATLFLVYLIFRPGSSDRVRTGSFRILNI